MHADYPLIQIVSRLGPSWYQLQFNQTIASYPLDSSHTPLQTLALFVSVIFTPL